MEMAFEHSLMEKARETRERKTDKFHNLLLSVGFEPPCSCCLSCFLFMLLAKVGCNISTLNILSCSEIAQLVVLQL